MPSVVLFRIFSYFFKLPIVRAKIQFQILISNYKSRPPPYSVAMKGFCIMCERVLLFFYLVAVAVSLFALHFIASIMCRHSRLTLK